MSAKTRAGVSSSLLRQFCQLNQSRNVKVKYSIFILFYPKCDLPEFFNMSASLKNGPLYVALRLSVLFPKSMNLRISSSFSFHFQRPGTYNTPMTPSLTPPTCLPTPECTFLVLISSSHCKGVTRGGSWGARDPPFVSLFLSKQPTIFRGENAMTMMFDTV